MIPLLDTHQHLIYRDRMGYGWTSGFPALATGSFTLDDYARLTQGAGVAGSLFMETAVDEGHYRDEPRMMSGLAKDPAHRILGLIASIRPESDEGFVDWFEEAVALGAVGFRRVLHVVDDAVSQIPTFRQNVRRIGDAGKVFDMCFLARQLPLASALADAADNTMLVLDHCGTPDIAGNDFAEWREDISELAKRSNVVCKLSGLMAYCAPGMALLHAIRPYVDHVLEAFGPARMVWGSDWPVVNLGKGLPAWLEATRVILGELSEGEAEAIANANAQALYKVRMPEDADSR